MTIVGRDEFMKAMEDDYTPRERADRRMRTRLWEKLQRRMNRRRNGSLRKNAVGFDVQDKGIQACQSIRSWIRQRTEWLDLLCESNFMGFEPAKEWEELSWFIDQRDDVLKIINRVEARIINYMFPAQETERFVTKMVANHPPEIIPDDHIKKGVNQVYELGFNKTEEWAKVYNTHIDYLKDGKL